MYLNRTLKLLTVTDLGGQAPISRSDEGVEMSQAIVTVADHHLRVRSSKGWPRPRCWVYPGWPGSSSTRAAAP
jgi:hypothetical protein